MLPKSQRLSSGEVENVMKKGRRISSSLFLLSFIKDVSKTVLKCAVIIPKKVAKTSVLRHRHKRRIMSILHTLELPQGHIIISLRADISKIIPTELKAELKNLLAKAQ
jgi:ribonuclease P protein component